MSTRMVRPAVGATTASPTELLPTDSARTYTHIHASLVLLLLSISFNYIVTEPVMWLSYLLLPVCLLQGIYCIVCLPTLSAASTSTGPMSHSRPLPPQPLSSSSSSSSSSPTSAYPTSSSIAATMASRGAASTNSPTKRKTGLSSSSSKSAASFTSKATSSIIAAMLSLAVVPPFIFIVLVLHGAPLTTHHAHTALLALHMAVLAAPALFYTQGVSAARWRELVSLSTPVDEVLGGALGAFVGAWLGAIPIPLDWDREWQKWPVTVLTGSYVGWAVGRLAGGWLLKGRCIHFHDY